jgi:hypothetical protein
VAVLPLPAGREDELVPELLPAFEAVVTEGDRIVQALVKHLTAQPEYQEALRRVGALAGQRMIEVGGQVTEEEIEQILRECWGYFR